jgi:hypothetical protein
VLGCCAAVTNSLRFCVRQLTGYVVSSGELVMRTTVAAEPRSLALLSGFKTKTYVAQPFPFRAWVHVPVSTPIKWFDGVYLTWASQNGNSGERASNRPNVGFLAERLGSGS